MSYKDHDQVTQPTARDEIPEGRVIEIMMGYCSISIFIFKSVKIKFLDL